MMKEAPKPHEQKAKLHTETEEQLENTAIGIGDVVEVRYGRQWFPARVVEIKQNQKSGAEPEKSKGRIDKTRRALNAFINSGKKFSDLCLKDLNVPLRFLSATEGKQQDLRDFQRFWSRPGTILFWDGQMSGMGEPPQAPSLNQLSTLQPDGSVPSMPPEEQFRLLFTRQFAQSLSQVSDQSLVPRVLSLLNIAPAMNAVLNFGNLLPTVLQPLFVVVVRPPPTVQVRVVTYGFLVPRKGSSGSGAILRGKDGRPGSNYSTVAVKLVSADLLLPCSSTHPPCVAISAFTKYTTRENSEQLLSEDVFLLHQIRNQPAQQQQDFFGGFVGVVPRVLPHGSDLRCKYGLVYLRSSSARRNVKYHPRQDIRRPQSASTPKPTAPAYQAPAKSGKTLARDEFVDVTRTAKRNEDGITLPDTLINTPPLAPGSILTPPTHPAPSTPTHPFTMSAPPAFSSPDAHTIHTPVPTAPHHLRTTEISNVITERLSSVSPRQMVRLFQQTDAQLFNGHGCSDPSLYECAASPSTATLVSAIRAATQSAHALVVLSGAGASGNMAFYLATRFNREVDSRPFRYLVAGGDHAIVRIGSSEEDNAVLAVSDLKTLLSSHEGRLEHLVYVGISCGLSACYVGAQLDWLMDITHMPSGSHHDGPPLATTLAVTASTRVTLCVLGFTPVHTVVAKRVGDWRSSFASVLARMQSTGAKRRNIATLVLTPTVGPEAVRGSTRLKGGSATKIFLASVFASAINGDRSVLAGLHAHENVFRQLYLPANAEVLARLVAAAGASISSPQSTGGRLFYLENGASCMGLFDAAECPVTFGSDRRRVQAFVRGGWASLGNREGCLATPWIPGNEPQEHPLRISLSDVHQSLRAPSHRFEDADTVLCLCSDPPRGSSTARTHAMEALKCEVEALVRCVCGGLSASSSPTIGVIVASANPERVCQWFRESFRRHATVVSLPAEPMLERLQWITVPLASAAEKFCASDFALKMACNTVSTGAHVMRGDVLGNRMVNLKIQNVKLVERAVRIMMELTEASRDKCLQAIVESVVFGLKNSLRVVDRRFQDAVALQTGVQHARQSPREFWQRVTLLVATACRKHGHLDRVLPRALVMTRRGISAEIAQKELSKRSSLSTLTSTPKP